MMSRKKKQYEEVNKIVPSIITKADIKELSDYCMADEKGFDHLGEVIENKDGTRNVFIKNQFGIDAPVLAIAHLDTALALTPSRFQYHPNKHMVVSQALDDRLGVWALCRKLPMFIGNRGYDVLLTVGEETGNSSASHFDIETEKYNWIFQLDRMGCDAVYYDFDSTDWLAALRDSGWAMNRGSFSDISTLRTGTVSAVNFGIAYKGQHTSGCYAYLDLVATQLYRVAAFYKMYEAHKFLHTYKELPSIYGGRYSRWNDTDYTEWSKPYKYEYPQLDFAGNLHKRGDGLCYDCAAPIPTAAIGGLCKECLESYDLSDDYDESYNEYGRYSNLGNESIKENE